MRIAPNWTSAAGALEGILEFLGEPLPRHAVMGLTGHAWHLCLGTAAGVVALPSGPTDLDWNAMCRRYARTGVVWERFGGELPLGEDWAPIRDAAVEWAIGQLDAARPLIGWDFHLHEHAVVFGYDRGDKAFFVDDILTPQAGPLVPWDEWPSSIGRIELFAPIAKAEVDPIETVGEALETALACFAGEDGEGDAQPRGTGALDAWADAMDGDVEVDRAGNAYTLQVLQPARLDGAAFLRDLATVIPELAEPLGAAELELREEAAALAPLLTLFPFPSGGHGNVANAGLRRAAGMALRRAAAHERAAGEAIRTSLDLLGS